MISQEKYDPTVYLLFGKENKKQYNLDYRAPLSLFQAVSLVISCLDINEFEE